MLGKPETILKYNTCGRKGKSVSGTGDGSANWWKYTSLWSRVNTELLDLFVFNPSLHNVMLNFMVPCVFLKKTGFF
jgi:hypothetical protein